MKREQQAYWLSDKTNRGSNEDSIAEMVQKEFNVNPYSNRWLKFGVKQLLCGATSSISCSQS
ncbi:hypothetical protein [Sphingobacterium wenxiniae]|uniref:hypothetical protein n=1 Tax=Sphingobacterium wenxiniae TaxID=683125 RepID=UPI000B82B131|nr:hypothetical protein [Sphingobacterium wenxiniae]